MLKSHLGRQSLVLADFVDIESQVSVSADREDSVPNIREDSRAIQDQIIAAYAILSNHRSNVRVRLADLRSELPDVPRQQLDHVLQRMTGDGLIVLNRLDNPLEITPEDEDAKIVSPLGDPRHIMHMEIHAHV
jgi:hypothetical protein